MKDKNSILTVGLVVAFTGIGFFAGVKYQQAKQPSFSGRNGDFPRQGQMIGRGENSVAVGDSSTEMIRGKIVSKDEDGITLELDDGSSKVVLVSETTLINETVEATFDDLAKEDQVMIFGQTDSSGAVTASQIQVNFGNQEFNRPQELK